MCLQAWFCQSWPTFTRSQMSPRGHWHTYPRHLPKDWYIKCEGNLCSSRRLNVLTSLILSIFVTLIQYIYQVWRKSAVLEDLVCLQAWFCPSWPTFTGWQRSQRGHCQACLRHALPQRVYIPLYTKFERNPSCCWRVILYTRLWMDSLRNSFIHFFHSFTHCILWGLSEFGILYSHMKGHVSFDLCM